MNLYFPPSSRIGRIVLALAIACLLVVCASVIFVGAQNADNNLPTANTTTPTKARVAENFGRLPLSFELNKGQTDKQVKFLSHGPGYDLFLTSTEAVLRVQKPRAAQAEKSKDQDVREGTVLRLKMLGASATPEVEGQEELHGKINYFIGNDPAQWRRNIPTYKKAYFKDIYPGIDVVYYGTQRELEYDFVIGPGANPKLIRFSVEGADQVRLDKTGKLLLSLKHGEVSLNKPVIYQLDENGSRREVKGTYVVNGNEVRFKLDRFNSGKALIIDPVLSYSTLLGSSNSDVANGIVVDSQGSAYVTGTTEFSGFPTTPGAFQTTSPRGGAFITKLDPTGSSLVYSTYLSDDNNSTRGNGIAVDATGNAYVTGISEGNFPLVNPLKTRSFFFTTSDAAANWNNLNTGLMGGIQSLAVAPTAPNTIYAPTTDGFYRSTDGGVHWSKTPSQGAQPTFNGANAIAVDPTNSSTVYVAFFSNLIKTIDGGNTWTSANTTPAGFFNIFAIVIDPVTPSTMYVGAGNGVFKSTDSGANWIVQNNFGVATTPIVRTLAIDPTAPLTIYAGTTGNGLFKSTNGGAVWTAMNTGMTGSGVTNVGAIAIDPANPQTIYTSTSLPGTIFKSTNGAASWDPLTNGVPSSGVGAVVVNSSGVFASVAENGVFKTTNGGANWTSAGNGLWNSSVRFLVAHPANASILYAGTNSSFSADAFVTKLNASGSGLLFSTLLGGNDADIANGIAVDANGNVAIVGATDSLNFPTVNAVQGSPGSDNRNAYVTKLNPSVPSIVFSTYLRGSGSENAVAVAIDSSSNVYVTGLTNSSDFLTANAFQPTYSGGFNGDAFVTKLTPNGALTYSTYLGGNDTDIGQGITADTSGNAYVTGFTTSTNFPTKNPIQPNLSGSSNADVFVTKLSSDGSSLVYSTYLGGTASDLAEGIAVDSANNVYLAGWSQSTDFPLVQGAMRTTSPMFKSVNGAASWGNDNYGFSATTITSMVIHPTEPSTVYVGTSNGVFKTTNGGRTWTAMNNGLSNRNVTAMVINPSTPATLYVGIGGVQANTGVYKTTDGGGTWIRSSNGIIHTDLISIAIDPSTPNTLYLGVNICCTPTSHIYKTTDGADNWALIPDAPPLNPVSVVIDPLNHSTIYVADSVFPTGAVYKSTNSGTSWDKFTLAPNGPVRWVSVSPHTAGLVYATLDQGLFRSTDGGANWTQVPSRFGRIYFDPVSPSTLYLLPNFQNSNVFKTTDNGQTWTLMNKGLNGGMPSVLVIDPQRPSNLYLAAPSTFVQDAFVTKINSAGNSLVYSTFIGSPFPQTTLVTPSSASAIAVDSLGNAYVTGGTSAAGFAVTPNSYQPFNRGAGDAFISKLSNSYIISGRVLNTGDVPLSGAEVVLNDGGTLTSVLTESDGSYQFSRLREGGNYTVSASKPQFTMTPASQTFNNLNSDKVQDFAALQSDSPFYTISGQVSENGAVLPGVTVTLTGSQVGLRTTDSSGNYSFEVIVAGNYTVTPSLLGFNFAPASATFNSLGANQIANFAATRQSFVVTNTNNHGAGSLREAITNANATIGTDTILFNIPGPGVKTITPLTALPEITDRVVIDATTQPGYAGTPLIEIDGSMANAPDGLMIKAGGTTVRGLSIGRFGSNGINLNGCDGNVIQGNYIGVAANGTTARQNNWGIQLTNSSNNLIGGTSAAARNVISGNGNSQIAINSGNSNVIQGNFIGTTAAGTAVLTAPFTSFGGIRILGSTSIDNRIGGSAPGAGNVISGHNGFGISTSGSGTVIQGNRIGTDVNGVNKIPNSGGVLASGSNIVVGGITAEARNVISGNSGDGVVINGAGCRLQNNYIGTDITGTLALSNNGSGVIAGDGALIGGTVPEMRNIIAGNSFSNVSLQTFGASAPVTVQGNYIGTDVTGTRAFDTTNIGIFIAANNNLVGGLIPGARNVISGNATGIQSSFANSAGNVIQGNFIGLNAAGTAPLGNMVQGISISGGGNNTIGGTQAGAANRIAFNGGPGVLITGSGQGNAIRGNSIFSNLGLGIDLGANGVTPNDNGDVDSGENNLQNFPVIAGVLSSSNSTTIQGSLNSLPSTTFQIDFYSNAAADPSGNGEGAVYFGTASVSTNINGDATINATIPVGLPAGRFITATATDPNGNTSEFSAADGTGAAGNVQFTATSMQVIEDVGTLFVTVVRTGGSTGSVSVDYSTANGTAIAGQDYTSTSGTLTFSNGETIKTIQIPITNDSTTETDETFTVSLRNDSNLEVIGAPSTLIVTLQDRNTTPVIFINSVAVQEGNTGTTTDALFIINLSAATGRAVSVNFATVNQSAIGGSKCGFPGVDYESASGNLVFSPTVTAFAIPIKVCGDNNAEANESFRIAFSNPVGAAIQVNSGFGTILDDDPLQLLLEESGPIPGQAAAVDAFLAVRDPFRVQGIPDFWPNVVDRNTRVAFYVRNLQLNPGETSAAVLVRFIFGFNLVANVAAEDVRPIPNTEFTQVVVRLPTGLPPNTYTIQILAHSKLSNTGSIRVIP